MILGRQSFQIGPKRSKPAKGLITSWPCKDHFKWSIVGARFIGTVPRTYAFVPGKTFRTYMLPQTGEDVGRAEACRICPNQHACKDAEDIREFWIPK